MLGADRGSGWRGRGTQQLIRPWIRLVGCHSVRHNHRSLGFYIERWPVTPRGPGIFCSYSAFSHVFLPTQETLFLGSSPSYLADTLGELKHSIPPPPNTDDIDAPYFPLLSIKPIKTVPLWASPIFHKLFKSHISQNTIFSPPYPELPLLQDSSSFCEVFRARNLGVTLYPFLNLISS